MSELLQLVRAARALRARGEPFAVATVIAVRGSSYRRPGARMILTRERWIEGSVSGGCVEGDLVRKLGFRMQGERPVVVTYDPEDGALGCNGAVDVLVEMASDSPADPLVFAERCIREQRRGTIATVVRGAHVGAHVAWTEDGPEPASLDLADMFVEPILPPPRLFVLGGAHDALPVVTLARSIGWETFVCVPHLRPSVRERFAEHDVVTPLESAARLVAASDRPLAVLMNHDLDADVRGLAMLLRSRVSYIGVLGPRARTERLLEAARASSDERVHAPVGLAIGAETPAEIALAIVAEARASLANASGRSLRERVSGVHREVA